MIVNKVKKSILTPPCGPLSKSVSVTSAKLITDVHSGAVLARLRVLTSEADREPHSSITGGVDCVLDHFDISFFSIVSYYSNTLEIGDNQNSDCQAEASDIFHLVGHRALENEATPNSNCVSQEVRKLSPEY